MSLMQTPRSAADILQLPEGVVRDFVIGEAGERPLS
jgi:hypothetical protein